jgi:hypothetical protein
MKTKKTSNAYIATDGESFMKVGKTNDLEKRERQIALPIKVTVACLDEAAAYRVESQLRKFIMKNGGIRHEATKDWFSFDPQIYKMLCEFAATQDGFAPAPDKVETEDDIEAEIFALRKRYFKLLKDELQQELNHVLAEKAALQEQNRRKDAEIGLLEEEIYIIQQSRWTPITQLVEKYGDKYPELVRMLKAKDEEFQQALQQKEDAIGRALQEKNAEIEQALTEKNIEVATVLEQTLYAQREAYFKNFTQYIAPLHEEIGALKAELRFLQERFGEA